VRWAREQERASWSDIAHTLLTTRQNAQQRFGGTRKSNAKRRQPAPVPNQHPGSNSIGAMTPDGWHTRSDAARELGVSTDTLKAWHKKYLQGDEAYRGSVLAAS
jgi:hypothetical protein